MGFTTCPGSITILLGASPSPTGIQRCIAGGIPAQRRPCRTTTTSPTSFPSRTTRTSRGCKNTRRDQRIRPRGFPVISPHRALANRAGQRRRFGLSEWAMNAHKLSRREALAGAGLLAGAAVFGERPGLAAAPAGGLNEAPAPSFRYCLNTATLRGQKLGIVKEIEVAAKAGYDAIEPWIAAIEAYVQGGAVKPAGLAFVQLG